MNPKVQTSPATEPVLDKYRISNEPYYLNIKNEVTLFEKAYQVI